MSGLKITFGSAVDGKTADMLAADSVNSILENSSQATNISWDHAR